MTLPVDDAANLLETLFVELGIDIAAVTDAQEALLQRRIEQSASKVLLFLNRDAFTTYLQTVPELWLDPAYDPADVMRAWPGVVGLFSDRVEYVSHAANAENPDTYDVTFRVGLALSSAGAGAISDYIVADVVEGLHGHRMFPDIEQRITSVSGGGQSVSYEKRPAGPDAAGGALTIGALTRFRRIAVGTSSTASRAPWPYGGRA